MAKYIDKDAIGVEVSWSFGDGSATAVRVSRKAARKAFADAGYAQRPGDGSPYIEEIDEEEALTRARYFGAVKPVGSRKGQAKLVIQELLRPNKDTPIAVGVYETRVGLGEAGDDLVCGARIRFENTVARQAANLPRQAVCRPPEGGDAIDVCMKTGEAIANATNDLFEYTSNADLSRALTEIGWSLFWIGRRRNQGGVWYIPSGDQAEQFVGLLKKLESLTDGESRRNQFIPQISEVYPKPLSMETWRGATADAFDAELERLLKSLDEMRNKGTMRDSTIEAHADTCEQLMKRADQYRLMLEDKADALKTRLAGIRDDFRKALDSADGVAEVLGEIERAASKPTEKGIDPFAERPKPARKPAAKKTERVFDESLFDEFEKN